MTEIWAPFAWVGKQLWRWEVVSAGALLIYGCGAAALFGDEYFVAGSAFFAALAWLTAKAISWEETRKQESRRQISVVFLIIGILLFMASVSWVIHRKMSMEKPKSSDTQPTTPTQAPSKPDDKPSSVPVPPAPSSKSPLRPKHPIIITSVHVLGSPDVGKTLGIRVNIKNVSDMTLQITKFEGVQTIDSPVPGPNTVAIEDDIWKRFIANFDVDNGPIEEINTSGDGLFNYVIKSPVLNEAQAQAIRNHSLVAYFTLVVRDAHSKKNLIEVCGYPQEDDTFTSCARHNYP